jgi:hypothetical protein
MEYQLVDDALSTTYVVQDESFKRRFNRATTISAQLEKVEHVITCLQLKQNCGHASLNLKLQYLRQNYSGRGLLQISSQL